MDLQCCQPPCRHASDHISEIICQFICEEYRISGSTVDKLKHHFLVSKRRLKSSEGCSLSTYAAVYFDKEQGFNMRLVNEILQLSLGKIICWL